LEFLQLVVLEGVLLISAGLIFFGGIWGTSLAMLVLSGLNYLVHDAVQFWQWEIPFLIGGTIGIILQLIIGKICNHNNQVSGLVGGLISLVLFGAFLTPIAALIAWFMVVGTGIIPKNRKRQVIKIYSPTIMRLLIGLALIFYGNFLTI